MLLITKQHKKVYCRYLCVPILFLLMVNIGKGQRLSPLLQYMNTNTTIALPQEFREMQVAIANESSETKPGLRVDALYKKIADIKDRLINGIELNLIQQTTGETTLRVKIGKKVENVSIQKIDENTILDNVLKSFEDELTSRLSSYSTKFLSSLNAETRKAIVLAIKNVIQDKMLISEDIANETDFGKILGKLCISELRKLLKYEIYEINGITSEKIGTNKEVVIKELSRLVDEVNKRFKTALLEAITPAEDKLYNVIQTFSKLLLSANTGIGVTEGTGMLNGGIHLSVNLGSKYQIGAYLNGELAKSDSTQPSRSLIGLQGRYTRGRFQCDFLASYLFGDKNFNGNKNNTSLEYGLGVGFNADKVVIGCAVTALHITGEKPIYDRLQNYIVTIRSSEPGSPILMLGLSKSGSNDYMPTFNISLPFN